MVEVTQAGRYYPDLRYPFEANLVIIEFESLAYLSHTIG